MEFSLSIFTPLQQAYFYVLAAILGAVFGSFFNCYAWRYTHGEHVTKGRSHCATCNHQLGVLDLIPVLSWLFLRGKCRYCGQKISPRYFLVEVLMAAVFALLLARFGLGVRWLIMCAVACILLVVALIDLETFTIPNGFVLAIVVAWVVLLGATFAFDGAAAAKNIAIDGLVGAFGIGGGMLVISLVFDKVTGKRSMGGGDIKLLFATGLFLGLPKGLFGLILACIIGLALYFAVPKRAAEPSQQAADAGSSASSKAFPFGPSIALSCVIAMLVGDGVIGWYIGLFL